MAYSDILEHRCLVCNAAFSGRPFPVTQRLRGQTSWLHCPYCGAYFSVREEIRDENQIVKQNPWGKAEEGRRLAEARLFMYENIYRLIISLNTKNNLKCLDIGSSFGGFAEFLHRNHHSAFATEINPEAVSYLQHKGISATCTSAIQSIHDNRFNEFDVIIALDCMYYWRNTYEDLVSIHQRLKRGGLLVVRNSDKSGLLATGKFLGNEKLKSRATHDHTSVIPVGSLIRVLNALRFRIVHIDFAAAQTQSDISFITRWLYKYGGKCYRRLKKHLSPGYVLIAQKD